ncbi:uncharacterized protein LOC132740018 [Ruditapes philippinarum]|uniref:uncharacterized protein LOC132740018 n=1 Tax=Ruditapes philippinarum TaxID=129788 RepID=UPI00295BF1AC|nr:uncharacterized protein LOC132740018 [Ruditapes philippinarum]
MAAESSDEIFNFKCTGCAKRNKKREAVKYCVECQGYCCQACVVVHEAFPTLVNHNLLDKASFKSAGSTNELPAIPTERCAVHETKIIDMYCQNHDDVGCTTCMTLEHRNCTSIRVISEVIDAVYQQKEVKQTLQKLKTIEVSKETLKERNDKQMQELQKSKKDAIQEIGQHRKVLEQLLADMEKESIQEVDYEFAKKESALIKQKKDIEREKDNIQKAIFNLQHAEGNKAQEFVCSKIAYKQIKGKDSLDLLNDENADVQLLYSINQDITSFLKQKKTFGNIPKYYDQQYAQTRSLYTVKAERKMNVKVQGDKQTCCIYGSCLTEDNFLLLADYYNKKTKCVDTTKAVVVDQCCLPDKPHDVCCTSKAEAAVSLDNKTIQFVSLFNPMIKVRQLKMNHRCFGIASKDDKLIITDNKSFFIHKTSGDLLQTVSKDNSGNELFHQSRLMTKLSNHGDKVYVASGQNDIVLLNIQGKHIDTYKFSEQSGIIGVCSDYRGNIFLCDITSGNIKQISQENMSEIGTVVKPSHGLTYPFSICFNHQQSTLIVTMSDEIKLFDLK